MKYERCVVVYDVFNEITEMHVQTVKLYNDPELASKEVLEYCNNFRTNRYWHSVTDQEELDMTSGNALVALYGYLSPNPTPEDLPEIITIYRVAFSDPDNDPYMDVLQTLTTQLKAVTEEEAGDETPYIAYTADFIDGIIEGIKKAGDTENECADQT